jgi:tetratricopeptide (TPR) repeat protein
MNTKASLIRSIVVLLTMLALNIPAFCGEIHDAAKAGDFAKVKKLLKDDPKQAYSRDDVRKTPLHWAVQEAHKDVVELLLAKGAEVNAVDSFGFTPLYWAQYALKSTDPAASPRSKDTIKDLIEKRHTCYNVIGMLTLHEKKYPEAIRAFKQALNIKEYAEGYYRVAVCLHYQIKVDATMLWYAKTVVWCEKNAEESKECLEFAAKAKENLIKIYKSIHDGPELLKIYSKAKGIPDSFWTLDES